MGSIDSDLVEVRIPFMYISKQMNRCHKVKEIV
jgi:hypothetical protein